MQDSSWWRCNRQCKLWLPWRNTCSKKRTCLWLHVSPIVYTGTQHFSVYSQQIQLQSSNTTILSMRSTPHGSTMKVAIQQLKCWEYVESIGCSREYVESITVFSQVYVAMEMIKTTHTSSGICTREDYAPGTWSAQWWWSLADIWGTPQLSETIQNTIRTINLSSKYRTW